MINRFVSSVNFRNRADKALTEKSSERRALISSIEIDQIILTVSRKTRLYKSQSELKSLKALGSSKINGLLFPFPTFPYQILPDLVFPETVVSGLHRINLCTLAQLFGTRKAILKLFIYFCQNFYIFL